MADFFFVEFLIFDSKSSSQHSSTVAPTCSPNMLTVQQTHQTCPYASSPPTSTYLCNQLHFLLFHLLVPSIRFELNEQIRLLLLNRIFSLLLLRVHITGLNLLIGCFSCFASSRRPASMQDSLRISAEPTQPNWTCACHLLLLLPGYQNLSSECKTISAFLLIQRSCYTYVVRLASVPAVALPPEGVLQA